MSELAWGWDAKSWGDVQEARQRAAREVLVLSGLLSAAEPDPTAVADAFERLRDVAAVGILAAAWCEP